MVLRKPLAFLIKHFKLNSNPFLFIFTNLTNLNSLNLKFYI